jgi:hypothetical protein
MENDQSLILKTAIDGKYMYNDEDISFDVLETITDTVTILSERNDRPFDDVYAEFMESQVYKALTEPQSGLWMENAGFIADEYEREKEAKSNGS